MPADRMPVPGWRMDVLHGVGSFLQHGGWVISQSVGDWSLSQPDRGWYFLLHTHGYCIPCFFYYITAIKIVPAPGLNLPVSVLHDNKLFRLIFLKQNERVGSIT